MRDSSMSAPQEGQCSHSSRAKAFPASTRSSEPRKECGTRNPTERNIISRPYLSLNSTHHAIAPVAQWWSDSLVFRPEKAVGPGFNPRPGLQTRSDYHKLIPDSRLHAILIPTREEIQNQFSARRLLDAET